jgi:hypothetical protein
VWNECIWLGIRTGVLLTWTREWTFVLYKIWLAERTISFSRNHYSYAPYMLHFPRKSSPLISTYVLINFSTFQLLSLSQIQVFSSASSSQTRSVDFSFTVRDKVSHPHKTRVKNYSLFCIF